MFRRLAVGLSALSLLGFVVIVPGAPPVRAGGACTAWSDTHQPPTTIRVLRTHGRASGTVQTVPFQRYVETTLAGEFGTAAPPQVLRAGAIIVKQYAWYFAMHWRGGRFNGHCYDVVDNTSDQLYWPALHHPTADEIRAVRETWSVSLRKWGRFFATTYRRGSSVACGANADGWRLFQHSAYRCALDGYLWPQILRAYYDPGLQILQPGAHDLNGNGKGDIAVIVPTVLGGPSASQAAAPGDPQVSGSASGTPTGAHPTSTPTASPTPSPGPTASPSPSPGPAPSQNVAPTPGPGTATTAVASLAQALTASIFPGAMPPASAAGTATTPLILSPQQVTGVAIGDVNGDGRGDLLTLQREPSGEVRVLVSLSTGTGFAAPAVWWDSRTAGIDFPTAATIKLVAGDFNGDGLADAALLVGQPVPGPESGGVSAAGPAKLYVLLSEKSRFAPLSTWWSGQLNVAQAKVFATDVDGDGKADLVVEEPYTSAAAAPAAPGPSPTPQASPAVEPSSAPQPSGTATPSTTPGAVATPAPSGTPQASPPPGDSPALPAVGTEFLVLRSRTDFGLADPTTWARIPQLAPDQLKVVASDVDGDGLGDLVVDERLPDGGSRMVGLLSNGRHFSATTLWQNKASFSWDASKLAAADVNGDGLGDVVVLYDLGSGGTRIYQFLSTGKTLQPGPRVTDPTLAWATARPY